MPLRLLESQEYSVMSSSLVYILWEEQRRKKLDSALDFSTVGNRALASPFPTPTTLAWTPTLTLTILAT